MKKNTIAGFLALAVASAGLLKGTNVFAITASQADSLRAALAHTATPEMPAKAGELVAAAKADERSDVAQVVVHAAVDRRPTLAASIVAAVATQAPKVSAVAAVEAAIAQPKQIGQITKAAVHAAPGQTAAIVAALCQKFPTQYNLIALAANEASPQSGQAILGAVAANVPSLKATIDRNSTGTSVDVQGTIYQTEQYVINSAASQKVSADQILASPTTIVAPQVATAPAAQVQPAATITTVGAAPGFGPPFQPVSPTPPTIDRNNTSVINTGGSRNYSGG